MTANLTPVQMRRLLARTLRVALDGGPAHAQLVERWANAHASEASWCAALVWDGAGAAAGWALHALDLANVAPPEVDEAAAEAYDEARRQSVQQVDDVSRVGVELEAAGVRAIALKGSALLVGNLAPALGIRWMSDVDLLVEEGQVEQAGWVLESLDYLRGTTRDLTVPAVYRPYHETFTSLDGRTIELHWRLGPARWGRASAGQGWFERARPSSAAGVLLPAAADLFWHFLVHDARNHAWSSGSLRAALDLALVARAPDFSLAEVLTQLDADPRPGPLFEAIADAANLSPILAAEVEPSPEPRYLRLAGWRDAIGRRRWKTERVSEGIAWGATLDRARRFGGWDGVFERALSVVPEAAPGPGLGAMLKRAFLTLRHAGFVGALAASHALSIPGRRRPRRQLPAAADLGG
jgi:putative nucleotidyltransferase-like protein